MVMIMTLKQKSLSDQSAMVFYLIGSRVSKADFRIPKKISEKSKGIIMGKKTRGQVCKSFPVVT